MQHCKIDSFWFSRILLRYYWSQYCFPQGRHGLKWATYSQGGALRHALSQGKGSCNWSLGSSCSLSRRHQMNGQSSLGVSPQQCEWLQLSAEARGENCEETGSYSLWSAELLTNWQGNWYFSCVIQLVVFSGFGIIIECLVHLKSYILNLIKF